MNLRLAVVLATILGWAAPSAGAAEVYTADGREFETSVPEFRGVKANAPIPMSMFVKNDGGSDGAGLCVIASNVLDGVYLDVPELRDGKRSATWRLAKQRPGGYDEGKLRRLWDEVGMKTPWTSVQGGPKELCAVIEYYTKHGVPCNTTMNTGRRYGYLWIAHMVTTIHLDESWACVIDNNYPDIYFWMPRGEYEKRLAGGGYGWVVVLLWRRVALKAWLLVAVGAAALILLTILSAIAVLAAAFVRRFIK